MGHSSFCCISLTNWRWPFPQAPLREEKGKLSIRELPEDAGLPATPFPHSNSPLFLVCVLVYNDFLPQKNKVFGEEFACARLLAYVLCFQMFSYDLGPVWGRKLWKGILMAAAIFLTLTSRGRRQNKNLRIGVWQSQSHSERLRYVTSD